MHQRWFRNDFDEAFPTPTVSLSYDVVELVRDKIALRYFLEQCKGPLNW